MKLLVAAIIFTLASISVKAQYYDGVYVGGSLQTVIDKYKEKGYKLETTHDWGASMIGQVGVRKIELYIFTTPKTKVVCKVVLFFTEKKTWANLKEDYLTYLQVLTDKYGSPDYNYNNFVTPYYEGDGYEMSAVELEKTNYVGIWFNKNNTNIAIEISKYKQVKITYENAQNMQIKEKEQAQIDLRAF